MKKISNLVVRVSIDTTRLEKQLSEFNQELSVALEGASEELCANVCSAIVAVAKDIIFTNTSPATGTGADIVAYAWLGDKFERLAAAVRARKFDIIIDGHY